MFDTNTIAAVETIETPVVVQNDNLANAAKASVTTDVSGVHKALFMLEQYSHDRESWEANEYAASRKRLYQLLTQCYEYYLTMKLGADKALRGEYKKALQDFCDLRGYKFQGKTHDMHRVVKAVFGGSDRRRISAYSQALIAALAAGAINDQGQGQPVLSIDLASWIESQGGIEEIRTGSKNAGMTRNEQAEAASKALDNCNALATITADFKTYGLDTDDYDKQMVLVVTYRNTGQLEINAVVKESSAVKEALACHFKANKLQASGEKEAATITQPLSVNSNSN